MDVYSALSALFSGGQQKDTDPRTATLFGGKSYPEDPRWAAEYRSNGSMPIETVAMQPSTGWDRIIDLIRSRLGSQTPEPQRRP